MAPLEFRPDVVIADARPLVDWYLSGDGPRGGRLYYRQCAQARQGDDAVHWGDVSWAVLMAGGPTYRAAASLLERGPVRIGDLPTGALHELKTGEIEIVADGIERLMHPTTAGGAGFGVSLATKVLHPHRRDSVPILDGARIASQFLDLSRLPCHAGDSPTRFVKSGKSLRDALYAIQGCLGSATNTQAWTALEQAFPAFTRLEIFDMAWEGFLRLSSAANRRP